MRCVKCGNELKSSKCAKCGFEHRGAKVCFLAEPEPKELQLPEVSCFEIKGDVLVKYRGDAAEVVIPDGVREIGKGAFYDNTSLEKVTVPGSVETIGQFAFFECRNLREVNFGEGIKQIGEAAFSHCKSLERLHIPDSVESIGSNACEDCESLKEVTLGNKMTIIEEGTFMECKSLERLHIPDSVETIGRGACCGCSSLKEVTLGENIRSIWDYAFSCCFGLETIRLPDALEQLEGDVFRSKTTVYVSSAWKQKHPDLAAKLGDRLRVEQGLSDFVIDEDVLVSYRGNAAEVVIPDGIRKIGNDAFYGDDDTREELQRQVDQLNQDASTLFDLYDDPYTALRRWFEKIREFAAGQRTTKKMTSVFIPEGVEEIGDGAFSLCPNLSHVHFPDTLKSIGEDAFSGDTALKSVKLPRGLRSLGAEAFAFSGLERLTVPGSVTAVSDSLCIGCIDLKRVELCEGVTSLGNDALSLCISLKEMAIPNSLKAIGKNTMGCGNLDVDVSNDWLQKHPDLVKKLTEEE